MCALLMFALGSTVAAADEVRFGVPPWPGEQVKAEVATQILDAAGYETAIVNLAVNLAIKGVAMGDISVDMAVWHPANDPVVGPLVKSNDVVEIATNIKDAKYGMAVPAYVWKAGVHSIADLHKFGDKFDHKIYGIDAGGAGNVLVQKAIDANRYDLGEFRLISSSTVGMMGQVKNSIRKNDWVVFLGWKPHWMNVVFDIKYLDDPEKMWGEASTVSTIVHPDFVEKHPNLTRFFKQMTIGSSVQSQWIYDYGYKKESAEKVSTKWILANRDQVTQWLDGVTTADGSRPAVDAVYEAIGPH